MRLNTLPHDKNCDIKMAITLILMLLINDLIAVFNSPFFTLKPNGNEK
jgi:hypothetical protein